MKTEKKIEDYRHFYYGVKCIITDSKEKFDQLTIHEIINPTMRKMALRPLSDITLREADYAWILLGWNEIIKGLEKIDGILREFNEIEEDGGTTNNSHWGYMCDILPFLLKQSFDLFGLIDAGLAIDKTKMK